jgi:hypothetical protein
MELDELKAGWQVLDQRLAKLETVPSDGNRDGHGGVRAELRPLAIGQCVQIVAGLVLTAAAGSFWFHHRGVPNLLVTGLLLHLYGIAMVIAAARNLFLVGRANETAPVVELQRRVATLRAWRIREGRWFGIVGCFMWVALIVWAFGLLGVDIVAARPAFVGFLLLTAVVCLGVFAWVTRLERAPEGRAVHRARERLDEIAHFEAG